MKDRVDAALARRLHWSQPWDTTAGTVMVTIRVSARPASFGTDGPVFDLTPGRLVSIRGVESWLDTRLLSASVTEEDTILILECDRTTARILDTLGRGGYVFGFEFSPVQCVFCVPVAAMPADGRAEP